MSPRGRGESRRASARLLCFCSGIESLDCPSLAALRCLSAPAAVGLLHLPEDLRQVGSTPRAHSVTRSLPPQRTATDLPSVGSVGPWRYRCRYSEYANTPAVHHCTAVHSRLAAARASLTPQLAVEGPSRGGPCQATISSEGREPMRMPGFAGSAAGSRVDVAVIRVSAAGPNLRGRG